VDEKSSLRPVALAEGHRVIVVSSDLRMVVRTRNPEADTSRSGVDESTTVRSRTNWPAASLA
jgi:hypothetical protein